MTANVSNIVQYAAGYVGRNLAAGPLVKNGQARRATDRKSPLTVVPTDPTPEATQDAHGPTAQSLTPPSVRAHLDALPTIADSMSATSVAMKRNVVAAHSLTDGTWASGRRR